MSKRILLTSLLVTVFVLLFFAVTSIEVYHRQAVNEAGDTLETYMGIYENGVYAADSAGADALSSMLGGARVTFYDAGGVVLADTGAPFIPETEISPEAHSSLTLAGELFTSSDSDFGNTETFYYKRFDGHIARISILIPSSFAMFANALPNLVVFIILDILLCLLFTWLATSFILRPVKELAESAIGTEEEIKSKHKELQPIADVLNQRNENLKQVQKSKDEFISNVTHEMNTPLTSVKGFAELIASGSLSKQKMQSAGMTIVSQSERLSAMITQILHYSAIDDDMLGSYDVDVSELIKEALGTYPPMLKEKNITLNSNVEDGVIIRSRRERMTEILDNLVGNAIKYNIPGGSITVTLKPKKLIVEDTGIGIPMAELPHIFSRFYTVDKSHGENAGFGLGLPIVKKICDRSGWKLSVDSTLGEGTVFAIEF